MQTIAVFDFLSHATMHLPFNAGYIKVLLAAFPEDEIMLFAHAGHCGNLEQEFKSQTRVSFHPQPGIRDSGAELSSPISGNRAAKECLNSVKKRLEGKTLRMAAMSGADANLLRVFRAKWGHFSPAPLHYILHNHLAASFGWRSRNPYYRWFDFASEFKRGLPNGQYWVTLEKGIKDAVLAFAPKLAGHVIPLPHPITYDSALSIPIIPGNIGALKVAFLGHCGPGKGFDFFVDLANEFAGPDFEFWAIGRENPELSHMDMAKLTHKPTKGYLASEDYYTALSKIDLVVLPLDEHYKYVASGSVLDAISCLKPIVIVNNSTYQKIAEEYGAYGPMVDSRDSIIRLFKTMKQKDLIDQMPQWINSLTNIRAERDPQHLAAAYKKTIAPYT
ncbi:MAG: glycosyltransferase [Kordiimonadaceae bacterium]|nr:glycosyltransferase [Kordiimonadaceae bacterium]